MNTGIWKKNNFVSEIGSRFLFKSTWQILNCEKSKQGKFTSSYFDLVQTRNTSNLDQSPFKSNAWYSRHTNYIENT